MPKHHSVIAFFGWRRVVPAILCSFVSTAAFGQVIVNLPWARATTGGQRSAPLFMKLEAQVTGSIALRGASSPLASLVEIRVPSKTKIGGTYLTRTQINIAAGSYLLLNPGAPHLMLVGLGHALEKGARVPVTLEFETQEKQRFLVNISAEVVSPTAHSALDHHH